jgi:hypothetical protein
VELMKSIDLNDNFSWLCWQSRDVVSGERSVRDGYQSIAIAVRQIFPVRFGGLAELDKRLAQPVVFKGYAYIELCWKI